MTNCLAPYSESSSIHKAYSSNGLLNSSIGFVIPIYENMPKYMTENPNIIATDYDTDNTKVYADVTGNLNVRVGPSTSYEILTTITRDVTFTRIKKGKQNGERWDKIELENGMVGYVFQSYIKEVPEKEIQKIDLSIDNKIINVGSTANVKIEIEPQDAKKDVIWSSSDENIVIVENGLLTAISPGTAIITAQNTSGTVKATIEIIVEQNASKIILSKDDMQILKGDSIKLTANILPENTTNKNLVWVSQDTNIVDVTNDGIITAKETGSTQVIVKWQKDNKIQAKCNITVKDKNPNIVLEFSKELRVEADEISKIDIEKSKVREIKKLINTNLNVEIYKEGKLLSEDEKIGTGTQLILKDANQNEVYKYVFIIYGDVNGDGLINSLDVLVLQKHILEIKEITGIYKKAANISKNGRLPNSLDVLKVQKHILETKFIEQ